MTTGQLPKLTVTELALDVALGPLPVVVLSLVVLCHHILELTCQSCVLEGWRGERDNEEERGRKKMEEERGREGKGGERRVRGREGEERGRAREVIGRRGRKGGRRRGRKGGRRRGKKGDE